MIRGTTKLSSLLFLLEQQSCINLCPNLDLNNYKKIKSKLQQTKKNRLFVEGMSSRIFHLPSSQYARELQGGVH